uniref:histidine kinase n=1 Tax=Chromera velia CCMP2878 TaxID=1169474 RepID=A0A0G4HYJ8_9ALVE|eukprot:Cvel_9510.t1-p1 / transcript=Cvel_9510.t1 / gene=Cvel_9510 / organism=Chromera_velia_CCMP2878 / gene_product=Two-component system protein B, putative / transcript_product=Two-component system protein B, putative / location=Cvel_scaffold550:13145-16015(+) / protein_length=701 / sequence_SO=supercontig / SO=protein_coding / is_pseudo=false
MNRLSAETAGLIVSAIDVSDDLILSYWNKEGVLLSTSPTLHRVLGHPLSKLVGSALYDPKNNLKQYFRQGSDGLPVPFQSLCTGSTPEGGFFALERASRVEHPGNFLDYFENGTIGLHMVGPDGTILWANKQDYHPLGYSEEEYIGHNITKFHADGIVIDDILQRLTAGEVLQNYPANLLKKDKTCLKVLIDSSTARGAQGEFLYTRCFTRVAPTVMEGLDVEINKKAIEASSKIKSDFVKTMSHELRTPLNGIIGMSSLLMEMADELEAETAARGGEKCGAQKQREYYEAIAVSGDLLLELVNDILDLSKAEAGKLELESAPFDAAKLVSDVCRISLASAELRRLTLEKSCDFDEGMTDTAFYGDSFRLKQILLNFVGNAIKFSDSGTVKLSLRVRGGVAESSKRELLFSVHDEGIGIEDTSVLFQPFTQANPAITRKYGGTGLGLSICRTLSELMGGSVGVTSQLGKGSTFWLKVELTPCAASPTVSTQSSSGVLSPKDQNHHRSSRSFFGPASRGKGEGGETTLNVRAKSDKEAEECEGRVGVGVGELAEEEGETGGLAVTSTRNGDRLRKCPKNLIRVLIVDDNMINRLVLSKLLSRMGFHDLKEVHDGQQAVDAVEGLWEDSGEAFDLIFMDVNMPVLDGLEATRKIRELPSGDQVYIFGVSADADASKCVESGMDLFIPKPVSIDIIRDAINRCA